MLYNLSNDMLEDLEFAYAAITSFLFFTLLVPVLLTCILCMLAVLGTPDIDDKVRVFLINRFIIEIINWAAFAIYLICFPERVKGVYEESEVCSVVICMLIIATLQNFATIAVLVMMVFAYARLGASAMQWGIVIPSLVFSWGTTILVGTMPYYLGYRDIHHGGFCEVNQGSPLHDFYFYSACVHAGICCSAIIFFAFAIVALRESATQREKSNLKILLKFAILFLVIAIFRFNINILPFRMPNDEDKIYHPDHQPIATGVIFLLRVIVSLPSLIAPVSIVLYYTPSCRVVKQIVTCFLWRPAYERHQRLDLFLGKMGEVRTSAKKRLVSKRRH